jgi:small subunit ribosomal protein S3Ae
MAKEISSWKQKTLYRIIAPDNFESKEVGNTLGSDPKNLIGRRIDVSLKELTDDKTKQHLKVILEINDVKEDRALTKFRMFSANQGYLHSKVRKGMSKIDYIGRLKLADGTVRIKVIAVTHKTIKSSQKKEILARITKAVESYKNSNLTDFVQATLFGKLGTDIYHNCKNICPISRVEVEEVRVF